MGDIHKSMLCVISQYEETKQSFSGERPGIERKKITIITPPTKKTAIQRFTIKLRKLSMLELCSLQFTTSIYFSSLAVSFFSILSFIDSMLICNQGNH